MLVMIQSPLWAAKAIEPKRASNTDIPSIMTFRVSLLDATRRMSTISGSLTAFRPFELGMGYTSSFLNSYFVNTGIALPWNSESDSFTNRLMREIFVLTGYQLEEPGPLYDEFENNGLLSVFYDPSGERPPDKIHSLTFQVGMEAIEWFNPMIGLDLRLSLGFKYMMTNWAAASTLSPMTDISLGIAF